MNSLSKERPSFTATIKKNGMPNGGGSLAANLSMSPFQGFRDMNTFSVASVGPTGTLKRHATSVEGKPQHYETQEVYTSIERNKRGGEG